jgi:branched-chain amino acid transport system substrate-binding protein
MKQMASFKDVQAPLMLPGVKWNTSPTDFALIEAGQLARFDGEKWVLFGDIIGK